MPSGPHSFGEHPGKGQNNERVLTFNAAQICIGPVLAEIRTSSALKLIMLSLNFFPSFIYSTPIIFFNSSGGLFSVITTLNFSSV